MRFDSSICVKRWVGVTLLRLRICLSPPPMSRVGVLFVLYYILFNLILINYEIYL